MNPRILPDRSGPPAARMTASVYPIMYPMAWRGCMPSGRAMTKSPFSSASCPSLPPDVMATMVQPRSLACPYISMVSAVFPE